MNFLGLDVETTGLDTATDQVIEVGAVLWDATRKAPLSIVSEIIRPGRDVKVSDEITRITGITQYDVDSYGQDFRQVWAKVEKLMARADACMAHNAPFDAAMLKRTAEEHGMTLPKMVWIDTMTDLPYPDSITVRALPYLAVEHGFMNPFSHRAAMDVLTMLRISSHYNPEEVMALAKMRTVIVRAMVSYDDREKAKARGYRWDGERKWWIKPMKETRAAEEMAQAPFKVVMLSE
jgi:DNA polymerase-3 subunit epsilon